MNPLPAMKLVPFRKRTSLESPEIAAAELQAMASLLPTDGVVFDVGAHHGSWTLCAARLAPGATFHMFEPDPEAYLILSETLRSRPAIRAVVQNATCGAERAWRPFHRYADFPSWNTVFRRTAVEEECGLNPPSQVQIPCFQLDEYCRDRNIPRIRYLRVSAQGAELDVLAGARGLLSDCRIDSLQFSYGGTFKDAGRQLSQAFELLDPLGYDLYKVTDAGLLYLPGYRPALEDFEYCQYAAVHSRLRCLTQGLAPVMIDVREQLSARGIVPKGVVHVGAHLGGEVSEYLDMGFEHILLVEANPVLAKGLFAKYGNLPQVTIAACAASSESGSVELHITTGDQQSSSILPLGLHSAIYPEIQVASTVRVPADTIDNILASKNLRPEQFNFLNIDIQGAELLALKGAKKLLSYIRAINTEVNFAELYQGCPLFYELNEWLKSHGFRVVSLTTPYHETWGDGFFVR
ncbi:MAG: FkbM family methyltransferase [Myxococcales bacterium]|nr:FkbM family methyltransferase [Myxococcales bacterium]